MSKAMVRAERAARSVVEGKEILDFLKRPPMRKRIAGAADAKVPPVTAVSQALLDQFGKKASDLPVRSFIGLCVRAILEESGYHVVDKGVRLRDDPIFVTGSVYEKSGDRSAAAPGHHRLLDAIAENLSREEALYLITKIQKRFRAP